MNPTETPNVVIETANPQDLRIVIDGIGALTFIAGAIDLASMELDFAAITIPVMAGYTAARVVFGFSVDNTNTPKS